MNKTIHNPNQEKGDISGKVLAGLERISEVFKKLLWEKAKLNGLSPIQIQILNFIAFHKIELCNVSSLAKEFNVTKPTISDAVKVLNKKGLIVKDYSPTDKRSYSINLSLSGEQIVAETKGYANPLKSQIEDFDNDELESVFKTLNELIYKLNRSGIITVQRTCYGCKFYEKRSSSDYCNLMEKELLDKDIRIDCPDYIKKSDHN